MQLGMALAAMLALAACGPDSNNGGDGDGGDVDADTLNDGGGPIIDATPGPDGIVGCNPQNFTLQQAPPPEVYLVVDRSGSMNDPGAAPPATKWDELKGAADSALTQFEAAVHFGLLMYPQGAECTTPGPQVGVAVNQRSAINFELENSVPAGGTPTSAAVRNAADSLADIGSVDSPKFIILMTDGGPNCNYFLDSFPECSCTYASSPEFCCTSTPNACLLGNTCLDDSGTLATINTVRTTDGIDTFVIGLPGTAEYESLLNEMALAGGRPQIGGSTDYFAANNQAELDAALQQIAVSVISCTIPLSEVPAEPDFVRIFIDGVEIPRDVTDGWDYSTSAMDEIELNGAACVTLQDGAEHTLTATFACVVE